jgi:phosphoserine phosphatase
MISSTAPEALLIHISGHDGPGITAACTAILAAHHAAILDIGQAVVHENLALGILITAPEESRMTPLKAALHDRMLELGLHARFTRVRAKALEHWMRGLGRTHFIVTLLGSDLSAPILARVSAVLAASHFNVDRIERLSAQICGQAGSRMRNAPESANACIELAVSGDAGDEAALRSRLLAVAQEFSIDIACQGEGIFRLNRRLFAFDMDSTLIQGEVIDELARLAGVGEQVAQITEAAMRGELDFDQSFTRRVALLKGLPAERVYSLLGAIPLAEGAERMFRVLKLLGLKTAILSGGFTFFARSLQERFGIDHVHANELEMVDGVVTGRVIPPIVNGARKAQLLGEIAGQEGISLEQVVAVGDGANDIPMLNLAGMGIAYRAKPLVRQQADHAISRRGLDGLLYLIGLRDRDLLAHEAMQQGEGGQTLGLYPEVMPRPSPVRSDGWD